MKQNRQIEMKRKECEGKAFCAGSVEMAVKI